MVIVSLSPRAAGVRPVAEGGRHGLEPDELATTCFNYDRVVESGGGESCDRPVLTASGNAAMCR